MFNYKMQTSTFGIRVLSLVGRRFDSCRAELEPATKRLTGTRITVLIVLYGLI